MIIRRKTKRKLLLLSLLLIAGALYVVLVADVVPWDGIRLHKSVPVEEEPEQEESLPESSEPEEEPAEEEIMIAVHISGAVRKPDQLIYLPAGSRLDDAVKEAGGLLGNADLTAINLAGVLTDGQKIHIPRKGEKVTADPFKDFRQEEVKTEKQSLTNLNTASTIELMELPGIGQTYAQRIIEYREQNGGFASTEELMNVKGIGKATYEKIRQMITV